MQPAQKKEGCVKNRPSHRPAGEHVVPALCRTGSRAEKHFDCQLTMPLQ
jgi:hypothetical protein